MKPYQLKLIRQYTILDKLTHEVLQVVGQHNAQSLQCLLNTLVDYIAQRTMNGIYGQLKGQETRENLKQKSL